jgi:hypothetical protein
MSIGTEEVKLKTEHDRLMQSNAAERSKWLALLVACLPETNISEAELIRAIAPSDNVSSEIIIRLAAKDPRLQLINDLSTAPAPLNTEDH